MNVPPSYFAAPLVLLLLISPKLASLFWPFICGMSLGGTIVYLLMFNKQFKEYSDHFYKDRIDMKNVETIILALKGILLLAWPRNMSKEAFMASFVYLLLTIIISGL